MNNKGNIKKNFIFVWKETIKSNPFLIVYLLADSIFGIIVSVLSVYFPAMVITNIEQNIGVMEYIGNIILFVIIILITTMIKTRINIELSVAQEGSRMHFISLLNDCIMKRGYSWIEKAENQILINQATDYLYTSDRKVAVNGIHYSIVSIISMLIGTITYFSIIQKTGILIIVLLIVTNIICIYIENNKNNYVKRERKKWAVLDKKIDYINEKLTKSEYGKDIRVFDCSNWVLSKLYKLINERLAEHKKFTRKEYFNISIRQIIIILRDLLVLINCLYLVYSSVITIGEFVLYFGIIIQLFSYVAMGSESFINIVSASNEVDIIRRVLENDEEKKIEEFIIAKYAPEIVFDNVSFRYNNAESYTLKNISLKVKAGERIALVGENGSGKTTFIKLLCGLYKPTKGKIYIDGKDINQYSSESVQKCFSVVFQERLLLPFTVIENIAFAKKQNIDMSKMNKCIEFAGLDNQRDRLEIPLLKTAQEDGIELSGGEIQKVLLARALYKETPILLLDEPTAALDPMAEEAVYKQYYTMTKEKTSIFISHRLASTAFCDRIILLKNGEIIESGSHKELLELEGVYTEMFNIQKKYYEEGSV